MEVFLVLKFAVEIVDVNVHDVHSGFDDVFSASFANHFVIDVYCSCICVELTRKEFSRKIRIIGIFPKCVHREYATKVVTSDFSKIRPKPKFHRLDFRICVPLN